MRTIFKVKYIAFYFCLILISIQASASYEIDWGPLFSKRVSSDGEVSWRALGPLWEFSSGTNESRLLAIRPFYSRQYAPDRGKTSKDVLWPVWTGKDWDDGAAQWRCMLLASWRDDNIEDDQSFYSFRILPFYFQGRDRSGKPYRALFPLGGNIRNFLFYDEVRFCLFPLYGRTQVNDLHGQFALWPIFAQAKSDDIDRYRVFPFYGYSRRRDDFEKHFVMWPIWSHVRYGYPEASGTGYVFFPFWGHTKLTDQESWMFLPPFFRFSRSDRLNQTFAPWPFVQINDGMADQVYLWPFWGHKESPGFEHDFIAWPFYLRTKTSSPVDESRQTSLFPLIFASDYAKTNEPAADVMKRKVWPLYSWHREANHSLLRTPSLFPIKDWEQIDRNYAPLWTLYSREAAPEMVEHEVLWGLYRYRHLNHISKQCSLFPLVRFNDQMSDNAVSWSILEGALGYSRSPERRYLRLLYLLKIPLPKDGTQEKRAEQN